MEPEVIRDSEDYIIGEIREENGSYLVWKRERPSFPPTSRHTLLATTESLKEARKLAKKLLR